MSEMKKAVKAVKDLKLDPHNPRLPEELLGKSQVDLMQAFFKDYDLDELASSYIENGFFEAEALIVIPDGTVIEGNRRLAALKYLLRDEDAQEAGIPEYDTEEPISPNKLDELKNVPVYVSCSRDELSSYLGFHHINGPMQWSASSKARYITNRVDAVASEGETHPFSIVAKEIGSNVQGVRNAYRQYALLRVARDDLGLRKQASYVLSDRFGVWARLTSSNNVFQYIGFEPQDTDYASIKRAVEDIDAYDTGHFKLLLDDLAPSGPGGKALLNDSRKATVYTSAMEDLKTLQILRDTRDFNLVQGIIDGSTINQRLRDICSRIDMINEDLANGGAADAETRSLLEGMGRRIRGMLAIVEAEIESGAE